MLKGLDPKDQDFIVRTIKSVLPQTRIIAFGSRVRGDHRRYSDLDLALDNGVSISWKDLQKIEEVLAESYLPFKVDLLVFSSLSLDFQKAI